MKTTEEAKEDSFLAGGVVVVEVEVMVVSGMRIGGAGEEEEALAADAVL